MTDQVVTLRIVGENGKLVAAVKASKSELDSLGRSATSSGQQGSAGLDKIGESAQRGKRDLDAMGGSVRGLSGMIAGLGLAAIGKRIGGAFIEAADRAGQLEARIRNATSSQAEFNYVLERSGKIGRASFQSINTIGEIAINAAGPMRQLGFSIRDTLDLTEAMSLSLVASAANQQRSAATVDQFSKALQLGVLRGEAFNTVLSNAPEFVSALERSLGKTRAEIIAMANAGQLTVGELTKVASELDTLNQKVEAMPTTVEDAWVRFGDVFQDLAGKINKSSGATGAIVAMIGGMSAALGPLVTVAGLAAVAIGGRLVAAMVAYAVSKAAAISMEAQHAVAMRYGTVAALVKAKAMQGLNVAMSAFGGPVGLAITALTLFVLWVRNSAAEARRLGEEVQQGFQTAVQTMQGFNRETANEAFAGLKASFETLEKAEQHIASLEVAEQRLQAQRTRSMGEYGFVSDHVVEKQAQVNEQLEIARLRHDELTAAATATIAASTDMILKAAGITSATAHQQDATTKLVRELTDEGLTLDQLKPKLQSHIESLYGVEAGARVAAASFREMGAAARDAASVDWTDIDKGLNQQLTQSRLRLIEQTQGKDAAMRSGFALQLGKDGVDLTSPEALQRRAVNEEIIENTLAYEANAEAARKAGAAGKEFRRDAAADARKLEQQAESQARYSAELDRTAATLAGPLKVAEVERDQRLADLDAALKTANVSQADHVRGQRLAEQQYRATAAEIEREQNVMARVQDDYRDAIALQGLSSEAQRVELELRQRINDAKRAGRELAPGEIADLRLVIRESERYLTVMELQAAAAENYERMWDGALDSVGAALGDWTTKASSQYKSFGSALKDITKRFLADIIREFASTQLKRTLAGWGQQIASMMSSTGSGNGGGLMSSVMSMFTGGGSSGAGGGMLSGMYNAFTSGFSAAGTAGGGFWSSMMSGFSGAVSSFTGSLGVASTATTAYGSAMSGLAASWGVGGTGASASASAAGAWAANGGVSTAGLGAAAGVSWIPIVGWIVAGIMASSAAFKGGWDMQGQKTDISKWMMSKGNLGGAIDNAGISLGDNFLKAIGFSDSWAAAFSGSGLQTKLFGHKKPQVQGQGIQGSIGFGGMDGESYADIKAKGGWFRSDKKWTETGAMDSTVVQAFDNASMAISMRADDLAKQMGVDITAALDKVSIDIGKIEFDKDPEKARQQITDKIGEVMENLSAEAVKALGFARLLDDGFAASEIMGALSASIVLVTGGVDRLGKSLSALEIDHVARSVEYFESMAIKNGSSLGDQIAKTVGLLDEYASLITDVDTQLQTRDLNQYQSAQLQIELQYRSQIKSANQLAKALGLSGARSEDLAKIEQLRAVNMASLQTQMEAQKNTFLEDLGLGHLSTLRDDQKLVESMQLLRDAVGAGDMQRAQQMAQQSLGFGRNLYASGRDYSDLYGEVTGLIDGMTPATMDGFNDEQLDRIASLLEGLPQGIASAMFQLVVAPPPAPAPITPWTPPTPANPPGGGSGSNDQVLRELQQMNARLDAIANNTGGQLQQARSDSQDTRNNGRPVLLR